MNEETIVTALKKWNFWEKDWDTGIERKEYLNAMPIEDDTVVVIEGPRRAGKTYIMRQVIKKLIKKGISPLNILFINLEDPQLLCRNSTDLSHIFDVYRRVFNSQGRIFVFLDEVHTVKDWHSWVHVAREQGIKIFLSGSNASLISSDYSSLLTGRYIPLKVLPLSFREYLLFKNIEISSAEDFLREQETVERLAKEYLESGGFPEAVSMEEEHRTMWLQQRFEDVILKDVASRLGIRKHFELRLLALFLLSHVGSTYTYKSLETYLEGKISNDTIQKYVNAMKDAFLFFEVNKFVPRLREIIRSERKAYSVDHGVVRAAAFGISELKGKLLENAVFLELKRRLHFHPAADIFYWKDVTGKETDFVVIERGRVLKAVQVSLDAFSPRTMEREEAGLSSAVRHLKPEQSLIITLSGREKSKKFPVISFARWALDLL